MNCKNCGFPLDENDRFCKNCGAAVENKTVQNLGVLNNGENSMSTFNNKNGVAPNSNEVLFSSQNVSQSFENSQNINGGGVNLSSVLSNIDNSVEMKSSLNNEEGNRVAFQNQSNGNVNTMSNYTNSNNVSYQTVSGNINNQLNRNNANLQNVYIPTSKKNNSNIVIFIIIGLIVAALIFVGILSFTTLKDKIFASSGTGTNSGLTSGANYKVAYKGFTFNIPDNYVYELTDSGLVIGNELDTWAIYIDVETGSFEQIKAGKSLLQGTFQKEGYTSSVAKELTYGGVDYVVLELSKGGTNAIVAYAKLNSMYCIGALAYKVDNSFDYSLLEELAPIVASATYSNSTSNLRSDMEIDMSVIKDIIK